MNRIQSRTDPSKTAAIALGLALACIPLAVLLGWAASQGLGPQIVAAAALVVLPFLAARTRWATAFALAPVLLYPVNALNSIQVLHAINLGPLLAAYMLANVAWMYAARRRTTTPNSIALAGLLTITCVGLLESAHSGNGTLSHSLTTCTFWISAFFLGSLVADDSEQFATLGICALPLAGLAVLQAATGSNVYNHLIGTLRFAKVETYENLQRSTSTFGHPLVAGACLTILAFAAVTGRRRLSAPIAALVLLGAVVTVSRSALIGAALGFLVAVAQGTARRRLVVTVTLIATAVVISAFAFPRLSTSLEGRILSSPSKEVARTVGPQKLYEGLSNQPLALAFGGGIGTTSHELAASGGVGGVDTYDNQLVDMIFDIGFVPLLAGLLLLGYAIAHARPDCRRDFLPVVIGATAMLLFFDGLGWASFAVLFWFMIGALTSRTRSTSESTADDPQRQMYDTSLLTASGPA